MKVEVGLCSGRHDIKTNDGRLIEDFIWIGPIEGDDINDFHRHESAFDEWIPQFINQGEKIDLNIYVTGLTQLLTSALASVMNMDFAHRQMISLTLWHYDRGGERYVPQVILT
jgi:hypothetical protein